MIMALLSFQNSPRIDTEFVAIFILTVPKSRYLIFVCPQTVRRVPGIRLYIYSDARRLQKCNQLRQACSVFRLGDTENEGKALQVNQYQHTHLRIKKDNQKKSLEANSFPFSARKNSRAEENLVSPNS